MRNKDKSDQYTNEVPLRSTVMRVFWIAIQITLILWFGLKGYLFFYQGF